MNTGWILSLLVYAPHLAFFWRIFGPAAVALWLVLGLWLGFFLSLVRFCRERLGKVVSVLLAPWLWMGLEYFRSELYYLRFSWLNVGYAFSWTNVLPTFAWLGVYGIGLILMAGAAGLSLLPRRQALIIGLAALGGLGLLTNLPRERTNSAPNRELRVAGMQMEFPAELEVPGLLEQLRSKYPEADLYVLPEYTFQDPVPKRTKDWCRKNQKYLLVGGKEPIVGKQFYNMAYVIGPDGEVVFRARIAPMRAAEYHIPILRVASPGVSQLVTPAGRITETKQFPGSAEMLSGVLQLGAPARLPIDRWMVWPALVIAGCIALWGFWLALWRREKAETQATAEQKQAEVASRDD